MKIVRTADSTIIIITNFYLAASSHEIFLRVGGREGMKGLGALQRHQLPHPTCKNPGSATGPAVPSARTPPPAMGPSGLRWHNSIDPLARFGNSHVVPWVCFAFSTSLNFQVLSGLLPIIFAHRVFCQLALQRLTMALKWPICADVPLRRLLTHSLQRLTLCHQIYTYSLNTS